MNADFSDEIDRLPDLLNAEADERQKERETDKAHQTHQQELIEEEIRNGTERNRGGLPRYRCALNLDGTMRAAIDDNTAQRIDGFLCSARKHLGETRTRSFELNYKSEWSVSDIADRFRRDPRTIKGEIYAMLSFFPCLSSLLSGSLQDGWSYCVSGMDKARENNSWRKVFWEN